MLRMVSIKFIFLVPIELFPYPKFQVIVTARDFSQGLEGLVSGRKFEWVHIASPAVQSSGIAFQWGGRSDVLVTHPFPSLLENFQMLLRDPQRVMLFIYSKLFIFVF